MDSIYRKPEEIVETKAPTASNQAKPVVEVELPYLDYQKTSSRPYTADYFGLGSHWDDPQGGFPVEISAIEGYLHKMIESGEIANSQKAVKDKIKSLEKVTNVDKEERSLIKVETLAAYIKFLSKTDDIKYQLRKYGTKY